MISAKNNTELYRSSKIRKQSKDTQVSSATWKLPTSTLHSSTFYLSETVITTEILYSLKIQLASSETDPNCQKWLILSET